VFLKVRVGLMNEKAGQKTDSYCLSRSAGRMLFGRSLGSASTATEVVLPPCDDRVRRCLTDFNRWAFTRVFRGRSAIS